MTASTIDVNAPGVPFSRLVGVEMRKMADTRAGIWLLGAIVLITVAAVALVLIFLDEADRGFDTLIGTTAAPQGFLLPVLGVLLVTSEWGQRAALTTFTLVPRRGRIIGAKVVAAVLLGLAAIVLAVVIAALATLVGGAGDPWQGYGFGDLGKFALLQSLGILQGLAFGMLLLNSAAAIVAYFVVPTAFTVITGIISSLRDIQAWIDPGTAQVPLFENDALTGQEWGQLATACLLWIALPLVVGAWRMTRAEVK